MKLRIGLVFVLLAAPLGITGAGFQEPPVKYYQANEAEIETAFRLFSGKSLGTFLAYLNEVRPKARAVDDECRQELQMRAFAMAVSRGWITPVHIRSYQQSFAQILKLHDRADILEIKIFEHDKPYVMVHCGSLIMVSSRSVELAGSEAGLLGIIAHEVAHDYLSSPQLIKRLDSDSRLGREIELVCDGIAVATLLRLGLDPADYAVALSNNILSNDEIRRLNRGDMLYPSLPARLKMISLVSALNRPGFTGDSNS
jgi:hypothetical protein